MTICFNPYSIPVIIAAVICMLLALYVKRQKDTRAAGHLLILLFLTFLWCAAYVFELSFTGKNAKLASVIAEYISIPSIPVVFSFFVYRYTNPSPKKISAWAALLLAPAIAATVLMLTNGLHGLMYSDVSVFRIPGAEYTFLYPSYGTAITISVAYSYIVMLASFSYIIYISLKTTKLLSSQAIMLFFSAAIPVFINAMYYLKGFSNELVDYTPCALMISAALLTHLVTGMKRQYLRPLARDIIIENTADGTILLGSDNCILDINRTAERIFRVRRQDIIGKDCSALSGTLLTFARKEVSLTEIDIGSRLYGLSELSLTSDTGVNLGKIITLKDITSSKIYELRVRELAFQDNLTALPNHTRMLQMLEDMLRRHTDIAVLLINIGSTDYINCTYGYEAGDELIKKAAGLLNTFVQGTDIFARMRGDEFIIIRPLSGGGEQQVMLLADKIIRTFSRPLAIQDMYISASVNIGVCALPTAGEDAKGIVQKASLALGQAKKAKEHFALYSAQKGSEIIKRNRMLNSLRTSLERGEFSLEYQPQHNPETNTLCGVEALLRWTSPEFGSVPPAGFISILEDSGIIIPVGNWVIEESARRFKEWTDKGLKVPKFSINLSVRQFDSSSLVPHILKALDSNGIPRECLEVEVTETLAALADRMVVSKILQLSEAGVRIAVDDFGSGFSSLTYFKYLNINTLKVDREISLDIHKNIYSAAIFESLKLLCDALGVDIIAEYAENAEQIRKLISLGCASFQGYYFSKPLKPEAFEDYIKSLSLNVHFDELFSSSRFSTVP